MTRKDEEASARKSLSGKSKPSKEETRTKSPAKRAKEEESAGGEELSLRLEPDSPALDTTAPSTAPRADRPTRVLFIHPAYPSQFTAIGTELNKRSDFECFGLVHHGMAAQVAAAGAAMPHFTFLPDGEISASTYPGTSVFELATRNAAGIAAALLSLKQVMSFDAIVGHAGFGSTLYLKSLMDCALISYAELPSYQTLASRVDFPHMLDTVFAGRTFESLIYTSIINSDLGIVPSEHAKGLYPPELRSKIRVQMEGFDAENVPAGGPAEREALGLPVEGKLIGFFGRTLEAVRGFDIFIHVAKRLYEQDNTLRFLIVGEDQSIYGNETRYLQGQSLKDHTLMQVALPAEALIWRQTLPYDEFRRHIACLDLAILPLFEGAANWNLFEAMAVGLPTLSSDRAFVPEVIRDGKEGILLDPYDVMAFVEQATVLLNDTERARALGQAARARIRKDYSMANAVDGYSEIVKEAIAIHRAG